MYLSTHSTDNEPVPKATLIYRLSSEINDKQIKSGNYFKNITTHVENIYVNTVWWRYRCCGYWRQMRPGWCWSPRPPPPLLWLLLCDWSLAVAVAVADSSSQNSGKMRPLLVTADRSPGWETICVTLTLIAAGRYNTESYARVYILHSLHKL